MGAENPRADHLGTLMHPAGHLGVKRFARQEAGDDGFFVRLYVRFDCLRFVFCCRRRRKQPPCQSVRPASSNRATWLLASTGSELTPKEEIRTPHVRLRAARETFPRGLDFTIEIVRMASEIPLFV